MPDPPMARRSCCRHDQTAERIRDDWESGNVARKRTTPESVLATPEAIAAVPRPTVLKRRIGTGSEGVRLIRERSELAGLASEAWLLQEFLQHPQLTANSFLNRTTGAFHSACYMFWSPDAALRRRRTVPGGCFATPWPRHWR